MYLDVALVVFFGYSLGLVFEKFNIPKIVGMIVGGILLGPFCFNLISNDLLSLSEYIRKFALIIILLRAGFALKIGDLKEIGVGAILLAFLPATFEIITVTLVAPVLFNISYLEASILGAVIAGVSPAIVVPRMLKILEEKYGTNKKIPQLILAGASVDDIFVLLVFSSLMSIYLTGKKVSLITFLSIPVSIMLGIIVGIVFGYITVKIFKKMKDKINNTHKVVFILSSTLLIVALSESLKNIINISDLVAIMVYSITILNLDSKLSKEMSKSYFNLWVVAENFLFVLVGLTVNIKYIVFTGSLSLVLVILSLFLRSIGVFVAVNKSKLNKKEKVFCAMSYIPKATVQAGIGAIPLSQGVKSGELILAISVIYIIITAPIGAFLIEKNYKNFLKGV